MKLKIIDDDFEAVAAEMISQKRHADFMKKALDDYHRYLDFMSQAFLDQPTARIFTVRANYRHQKKLWREIEILGTQTLADLASAIIESMGWIEDHLHGFWFPDKRHSRIYGDYGIYHEGMEDDPHPTLKTKDVPISQIHWEKYPVLGFVFDFGDGHEFDITVKKIREIKKEDKRLSFPLLTDQRGVAPEQYPEF